MSNVSRINTDILIVGAGMTGLLAATDLNASGFHPLVVDKGRGVGGRLATAASVPPPLITARSSSPPASRALPPC
jgi:monoamine oxidase